MVKTTVVVMTNAIRTNLYITWIVYQKSVTESRWNDRNNLPGRCNFAPELVQIDIWMVSGIFVADL